MTIYFKQWLSPVGEIFLYADDDHLLALTYADNHKKTVKRLQLNDAVKKPSPVIQNTVDQLKEYFAGQRRDFDVPVKLCGTEFQKQAWQELRHIPFGQTVSYAQQAQKLRRPKAVRAVGTANGNNPISIILPCHRVIGTNGSMTGYAGRVEVKETLLTLEQSIEKKPNPGKV